MASMLKSLLTTVVTNGKKAAETVTSSVVKAVSDIKESQPEGAVPALTNEASAETVKHATAIMAMLPKLLENWLALGATALNQSNREIPVLLLFAEEEEPTVGEVCRHGKPIVVIPQGRFGNVYFTKQEVDAQTDATGAITHVSQAFTLVEPALFTTLKDYARSQGMSISLKKIPVKALNGGVEQLVAGMLFEKVEA